MGSSLNRDTTEGSTEEEAPFTEVREPE